MPRILHGIGEEGNLAFAALPTHDLSTVTVIRERCVALDRCEAVPSPFLEDSNMVTNAILGPVVEDEITGLRLLGAPPGT